MKTRRSIYCLLFAICSCCFLLSCQGDESSDRGFSWSPDGKNVALLTSESDELLLIDVLQNDIGSIRRIHSGSGQSLPTWSQDSKYILYSQSGKEDTCFYYIYSLADNTKKSILSVSETQNAAWSPVENRILLVSGTEGEQVWSIVAPDGTQERVICQVDPNTEKFCWSPDGNWICFYGSGENNIIQKVSKDGGQKQTIYTATGLFEIKWSPDSRNIALNKKAGDNKYELSIIDAGGKNEKVVSNSDSEFSGIFWNGEGNCLYFKQGKNIYKWESVSQKNIKLTFDNVSDFYGLLDDGNLYFSIEYPNFFSSDDEEWNSKIISFLIRGDDRANQLIKYENFRFIKLMDNIDLFSLNTKTQARAYFKSFSSELLETDFCPVIHFENGNIFYLPRAKKEFLYTADEYYFRKNYKKAAEYLTEYWDTAFDSTGLKNLGDVEQSLFFSGEMDSNKTEIIFDAYTDGALLRTLMVSRKLQGNQRDVYLDLIQTVVMNYLKNTTEIPETKSDRIIWPVLQSYGRYNNYKDGNELLELFIKNMEIDSSLYCDIVLAQALFAYEFGEITFANKKLTGLADQFPAVYEGSDILKSIIWFPLLKMYKNQKKDFEKLLLAIVPTVPADDAADIYKFFGDRFTEAGKEDDALAAYQKAVTYKFDESGLWERIFELAGK
ncbi:PD40 domain-containing protein [candidate division KSB1 bacterium]|nr:PD40 domain-containing protein [candidate division KSB1 bacterium]